MLTYPHNFEHIIHFDNIRNTLKKYCQTPFGQQLSDTLTCTDNYQTISHQLQLTWECVQLLKCNPTTHSFHLPDTSPLLNKISTPGEYLDETEILQIQHLLSITITIENTLEKHPPHIFPLLFQSNQHLKQPASDLLNTLTSFITPTGDLTPAASTNLNNIRQKLFNLQQHIDTTLQHIISNSHPSGITEENAMPTIREGRFVIPVITANKKKINGVVIDESDSGKTSFIEPNEIITANNLFRSLKGQEHREHIRILRSISEKIKPHTQFLLQCQNYIGTFDFLLAKAQLATYLHAQLPTLSNNQTLQWNSTYCPTLLLKYNGEQKNIVPFDINLSTTTQRIIIISGPNAGGKSVCLKTIALIQYMTQCGLLPPIDENSTMGIFNKLIIDIGDEQSLNNNLSTYSAHLNNMNQMIQHASQGLLFFIDEAGSGTEPTFGGAIAQSILQTLSHTPSIGIVTTHYSNIKMLASQNPSFLNASMLFNPQSLQPLYKLQIGKPGNSYALELAKQIGIPNTILENAKQTIGKEKIDYDKLIKETNEEKQYLLLQQQQCQQNNQKLAKLIAHYQQQNEKIKQEKKKILDDANLQAQTLLKKSNALIEKTIREIKESQAEKKTTNKARQQIKTLQSSIPQPNPHTNNKKNKVLHDFSELLPNKTTKTSKPSLHATIRQQQLHFNPTLDLRGQTSDEALQTFMNFLDNAIMLNSQQINVIHGTGTGALKHTIRSYLSLYNKNKQKYGNQPLEFSDGDVNNGGEGITIIKIP